MRSVRLIGRKACIEPGFGIRERSFQLLAGLPGKEVPLDDRGNLPIHIHEPLSGFGLAQPGQLALERFETANGFCVFRSAIEEGDERRVLLRCIGVERQDVGDTAAGLDLFGLFFQNAT